MNERIFYLEADAELSEFTAEMKAAKFDTLVFVVPRTGLLFESIVNLQILRSTAEEHQKNLVIICGKGRSAKMCEAAGIEHYATLDDRTVVKIDNPVSAKKNPPEKEFTPAVKRIAVKAESGQETNVEDPEPMHWREILARPSWQALIGLLLFSLSLFFFLSFVAFPGITITLKPEKKAVETITNIKLVVADENVSSIVLAQENSVRGLPIESVFEKQLQFATLSKVFEGTNANGEIVVVNTLPEEQRLRPGTRFQTEDGLVFRTQDWVLVPAPEQASDGSIVSGKKKIAVVADEKDIFGKFIGDRGNIPTAKFFLPGLPESTRDALWGESEEPFSGGVTHWRSVIAEADITAAQNQITEDLLSNARTDLEKFIADKNARESTDLAFLSDDTFLEKEVLDLFVEPNIVGLEKESFLVSAKLKVRTWAYSAGELNRLIWNALSAKTDPRMELIAVDHDSLDIDLIQKDPQQKFLKLSIGIRGAEQYQLDPRSEAGILFVNKIKKEIAGLPKSEAEALLANKEEVSVAHISIWPFWSRTVPKLPENISITIERDEVPRENPDVNSLSVSS